MVDNQHKKITGYRDLSEDEISLMNEIKRIGNEVGLLVEILGNTQDTDKRWAAIGKTHLQQGFMALTRAVANPDSF